MLAVAMLDRGRGDHFGVKPRPLGQLPVKIPAMTVRPVHHGRNHELFCFIAKIRSCVAQCAPFIAASRGSMDPWYPPHGPAWNLDLYAPQAFRVGPPAPHI